MSLTSAIIPAIVLCDEYAQERGACPAQHHRAARTPRPPGRRAAAGRRAASRRAGRAAPQLREGGMQVHPRTAARAVCVSAGRRPSDVRARGAGRSGPLAGGDLPPAPRGAGGDLSDQPGAAGPPRAGVAGARRLPVRAVAVAGERAGVGGDGRVAGQHGRGRACGRAALAARLGWPAAGIEVIDCDLGLSGRSATYREGFKELVARVCMGEVGAVFGLEVSRLARSNADLARLLELARLTGTLVIDSDGVYELSDINDRLLLGLKSQMSEAELHWLTSRLNESKRAAARRGELRVPLPVGFVHDDDGAAAVADVFAAFTATGSAYGVAGAFAGRRFPRRAYGGAWAGQVRWGRLSHARAAGILRNPVYAGAYVFGRRRTRQVVHPDGSVRSSTIELPRDQWEVLIKDHHQGFITFETYLANEAKLAANRTNAGARPPREGTALCQGIVFCGACGRSMQVRYQDRYPRYECSHSRADHVATPLCGSVRADTVDQAVTAALLAAVEPGQLALAFAAAGEVTARRRRSDRAAELAAERARYDADRAERAFLACEPENRLVARSLEARWETRLTDLAQLAAGLRWKSGASQQIRLTRRKNAIQLRSTDPAAIELACRIGPGCDNHALAAALNDAGHRTGTGQPFDGVAAGNLRNYHHIPYPGLLEAGELSPRQVAQRAGVSTGTIHYWINAGYLHARRGPAGRWAIPFPPEVEAACRDRAAGSAHQHRDTDPAPQADGELSIAEAARRLGVKPDVIYAWAQWGHLPARRGPAGRLWIHFTPEVEHECLQRIASSYKLPEAIRTQAAQRLERTAV